MSIVTITASVLAANGITIWIAALFWRIKRDGKDTSALLQLVGLLMATFLVFFAAFRSIQGLP